MRQERLQKEREVKSKKAVHVAIANCAREHEFFSLDVSIQPFNHSGSLGRNTRAVVVGRYFKPVRDGMRWGEPYEVKYEIVSDVQTGTASTWCGAPKALPQNYAIKEHIGVRERGFPRHSTL